MANTNYSCVLYGKKIKPNYSYSIILEDSMESIFPQEMFDITHLLLKDNNKTVEEYEYSNTFLNQNKVYMSISRPKHITENINLSDYVCDPESAKIYYDGQELLTNTENKVTFNSNTFDINKLIIKIKTFNSNEYNKTYSNNKIKYNFSTINQKTYFYLYYNGNLPIGNINGYQINPLIAINLPTWKNNINSKEYSGDVLNPEDLLEIEEAHKNDISLSVKDNKAIQNAGSYTIIATIKDKNSYCWNGEYQDYIFTITKKKVEISVDKESFTLSSGSAITVEIVCDEETIKDNINYSVSKIDSNILKYHYPSEQMQSKEYVDFYVNGKIETDGVFHPTITLNMDNYESNIIRLTINLIQFNWESATWANIKNLCKIADKTALQSLIPTMSEKAIDEKHNAYVVDITDNQIVFMIKEPIATKTAAVSTYSDETGNLRKACETAKSYFSNITDFYTSINQNLTIPYVVNSDTSFDSIDKQVFFVPGACEMGNSNMNTQTSITSQIFTAFNNNVNNRKTFLSEQSGYWLRDGTTSSKYYVDNSGVIDTISTSSWNNINLCFVISGKED